MRQSVREFTVLCSFGSETRDISFATLIRVVPNAISIYTYLSRYARLARGARTQDTHLNASIPRTRGWAVLLLPRGCLLNWKRFAIEAARN